MKKILSLILYIVAVPFVSIAFAWGLFRVGSRSRKHRVNPKLYSTDQRYYWVFKLMRKYLFIKRIKIRHSDFSSIPTRPCLFIGNHKSNSDGFAVFVSLYQHRQTHNQDSNPIMIAKKELNKKFSVVTPILDLIDTIYIDRQDIRQQVMAYMKQKEHLKNKRSIVIFPEGTRIYTDKFGEFKPGALKISFDTLTPIVPIVIYGSSGLMDSDKSNRKSGRTIYTKFLPTIQAKDFSGHNAVYYTEKLQNLMQAEYDAMDSKHKQGKEIF